MTTIKRLISGIFLFMVIILSAQHCTVVYFGTLLTIFSLKFSNGYVSFKPIKKIRFDHGV